MQADLVALNPRILVADDEPINLKIIQRLLKHCGCTCDFAKDGVECVSKALSKNYDVILMDVHMPGMDGIEAAREILQKFSSKAPTIVAVTASVSELQRQECEQAGFKGFIPKPIKLETLTGVLTEILTYDDATA